MKAATLSVYYALKILQDEGKLNNLSICLGLNTEREKDPFLDSNARAWIENIAKKSDYSIVCVPARAKSGQMVIEYGGLGLLKIDIKSKPSHAGTPKAGINAILILADWIKEIQALNDYDKGTTLNVGLVSGGTNVFTVPDFASCEICAYLDDPMDMLELKKD